MSFYLLLVTSQTPPLQADVFLQNNVNIFVRDPGTNLGRYLFETGTELAQQADNERNQKRST